MTVFSAQTKLPSHQYLRLLGNLEKLGKWSPFDSLELQPSSADCRYNNINNEIVDGVCYRVFSCMIPWTLLEGKSAQRKEIYSFLMPCHHARPSKHHQQFHLGS